MWPGTEGALRTRVYVDGYNLYYGCLKHTSYKWLDLRALVEHILPSVLYDKQGVPANYELCTPAIKYFSGDYRGASWLHEEIRRGVQRLNATLSGGDCRLTSR